MSNQQYPILCNTESDVQADHDNIPHKIFKSNDNVIPDFSEPNAMSSCENGVLGDNGTRYCTATKGVHCGSWAPGTLVTGPLAPGMPVGPETIENIIKKLDTPAQNGHVADEDEKIEFVTKENFCAMIGEMRVDILSLVNLAGMLNKNVTNQSEETANIKKDINRLNIEIAMLKEKLTKQKEENERRYNNFCNTCDAKFDDLSQKLQHRLKVIETSETSDDTRQPIKVMKKMHKNLDVVSEGSEETNEKKQNVFNDSNMDKNANKFKIVNARTKMIGADMFGQTKAPDEENIFTNRQIMRKDTHDDKIKKTNETKSIRASRLGLNAVDKK
jgi:hypothetical protein